MAQKIQDLKALSKLNRSNNINDVLIKSIKKENTYLVESSVRNSPRTLRNGITMPSRRRQHPKLKTISQCINHRDSEVHPLSGDLLNNDTSEKSVNDSTFRSNSSSDDVFYNWIEYHGDDSTAESKLHIQNMSNSNSEMMKVNQNSMLGSSETKFVNVEDIHAKLGSGRGLISNVIMGVTAKKTPKRIVFLIPAELEASVEIMKVQSIASVRAQTSNSSSGDELFSGINLSSNTATLLSSTTDPKVSDFLGPIKNKIKKNKKKRNAPYVRRIPRNCDKENHRSTVKKSSNTRDFALDNIKLEIPKSYIPRDFQQTNGSAGPIRSKTYRNKSYKLQRSYSNSAYDTPSSKINNAHDTNGNYAYSRHDPYAYRRIDQNKPYYNSKLRKIKLCWNCQSDSHLFRQCPLV